MSCVVAPSSQRNRPNSLINIAQSILVTSILVASDTSGRLTGADCATANAAGINKVTPKGMEGRGGLDCSSHTSYVRLKLPRSLPEGPRVPQACPKDRSCLVESAMSACSMNVHGCQATPKGTSCTISITHTNGQNIETCLLDQRPLGLLLVGTTLPIPERTRGKHFSTPLK